MLLRTKIWQSTNKFKNSVFFSRKYPLQFILLLPSVTPSPKGHHGSGQSARRTKEKTGIVLNTAHEKRNKYNSPSFTETGFPKADLVYHIWRCMSINNPRDAEII